MKKILILLVTITIAFSVNAQGKAGIILFAPADFKIHIEPESENLQLIDVRTPEEFKEGHLDGAINIDFYSEDFENQFKKLDRDQPVYLYCRSGYRSNLSALKLIEMGFKEIYDLEGGILNYK